MFLATTGYPQHISGTELSMVARSGPRGKEQVQTLAHVLTEIRTRYKVSFLYKKKNLDGKVIYGEVRFDLPLDDLLLDLLTPHNLLFERVNKDTYTIFSMKRKKDDRPSMLPPSTPQRQPEQVDASGNRIDLPQIGNLQLALTVRGKVLDEQTRPVSGATVREKGTSNIQVTNEEGDFTINVRDERSVLQISSVGFETQEIAIGNRTSIDITLQRKIKDIDEVVVIGYGTRRKTDLTSAVSTVTAEQLTKTPVASPELALQGRAPGVFVQSNSGSPTQRATVRIRGVSSFNFAEPLYVIDGVPIQEFQAQNQGDGQIGYFRGSVNILSTIPPDDIESISVLKDGASAAVYGSRAANGVILITTKRGRSGAPRLDVNLSYGINTLDNRYDVLNTQQLAQLIDEAVANNPAAPLSSVDQATLDQFRNAPTYDWQKAITKNNTPVANANIRISGGNAGTTYSASVGYYYNQANVSENDIKRYTLSTNIVTRLSRLFEAGLTYRFTYTDVKDELGIGGQNIDYRSISVAPPFQPIYDPAGPFGFAVMQPVNGNLLYGTNSISNSVSWPFFSDVDYVTLRNIGSAYLQAEPIKGLRAQGVGRYHRTQRF